MQNLVSQRRFSLIHKILCKWTEEEREMVCLGAFTNKYLSGQEFVNIFGELLRRLHLSEASSEFQRLILIGWQNY